MIKFIPYEVMTGKENMQKDSDLLDLAISEKLSYPIFRLYGWCPACISLGRNQQDSFIDKKFLKDTNIDVVKRLTGGRALLHDDEITYSFICPVSYLKHGENVTKSYIEISQILIEKFAKLGIELDFGGSKPVNTKYPAAIITAIRRMSLNILTAVAGTRIFFETKKRINLYMRKLTSNTAAATATDMRTRRKILIFSPQLSAIN